MTKATLFLTILYKISPKFIKLRIYSRYGWKLNFLYGYRDKNTTVFQPIFAGKLNNIYLYEYTRLQCGAKIITNNCKFVLKKFSAIGAGLTVATTNHKPTIGIPHYFIGRYNIDDDEKDIIVEEDVWGGTNITLLNGAHISRGCVIGAGSLVNKYIPPYAVVVGCPAKIIKYKYSIEQILEHEKKIYPESERFSKEDLERIFEKYYLGIKQMDVNETIKDPSIQQLIPKLY